MHRLTAAFTLLLVVTSIVGCRQEPAAGLEKHEFRASMLSDGSLKLEFFRNSRLSEQRVVPASEISPASSIAATHYDKPGLGPWCIVECHVNPSTSVVVAWNPSTDEVQHSPADTWGMTSTSRGSALVTVFRPHFNTPPDASDTIYVKGMELATVPHYGWVHKGPETDRVRFSGASERGESMSAEVLFSGTWTSGSGKDYEVFYTYYTLQMPVEGSNVRGVHRVFFVRNGKVEQSVTCDGEIVVQDNQLLEINEGGAGVPWPEAETWTEALDAGIRSDANIAQLEERMRSVHGFKDPSEVRRVVSELRIAAAHGDRLAIATAIHYPFVTYDHGDPVKSYATPTEVLADYETLFSEHVLNALRNARYEDLFVQDQGAMVADGEVWLAQFEEGVRIKAINSRRTKTLDAPPAVTEAQAVGLVLNLPEVRDWDAFIRSVSKGRFHGAAMADSQAPEKIGGEDCWPVTFGENQPERFHPWERFAVNAATGEVFVVVLGDEGEELRPLSKWRSEGESGRTGTTLLTENYRVTLYDFSEEGEVSHNKMLYHGVSRKTGKDIILVGSTWHHMVDGVPGMFRGWKFQNGDTTYYVHQKGLLSVVQGEAKVLVDEQGTWQ